MYLQLDQKTEDRIVEHFQKGDRLICMINRWTHH